MILSPKKTARKSYAWPVILFVVILYTNIFSASAQPVDTLNVTIDMRQPIQKGWFDPDTEIVGLRGNRAPLSWGSTFKATPLDSSGWFQATVPFTLPADSLSLSYKIKVEGIDNPDDGWQQGRNHQLVLLREEVQQVQLAWQDKAPAPPSSITGTVEVIKDFKSSSLLPRSLYVYLPPGYHESDSQYPVLYMHDGQNLFDASATGQEWQIDEAAQKLIKSGDIDPLIIVGVANTQNRIDEYTPSRQTWHHSLDRVSLTTSEGSMQNYTGTFVTESGDSLFFSAHSDTLMTMIPGSDHWQQLISKSDSSYYLPKAGITFNFHPNDEQPIQKVSAEKPPMGGQGDRYSNFLRHMVKPYIDQHYRTKKGSKYTALGGSSLGGLITLHIGLHHPDTFGPLLVASPSVWWDDRQILQTIKSLPKPTGQPIWLYIGTSEGEQAVKDVALLKTILLDKGWSKDELTEVIAPNAVHNEQAWAAQAENMLRFLFSSEMAN